MLEAISTLILLGLIYGAAKLIIMLAPLLLSATGSASTAVTAWIFAPEVAHSDIALVVVAAQIAVSGVLAFYAWRSFQSLTASAPS